MGGIVFSSPPVSATALAGNGLVVSGNKLNVNAGNGLNITGNVVGVSLGNGLELSAGLVEIGGNLTKALSLTNTSQFAVQIGNIQMAANGGQIFVTGAPFTMYDGANILANFDTDQYAMYHVGQPSFGHNAVNEFEWYNAATNTRLMNVKNGIFNVVDGSGNLLFSLDESSSLFLSKILSNANPALFLQADAAGKVTSA